MAEEQVFTGVLKKISAKDPQKYVVECNEAFELRGVSILMPLSQKPSGAELGDHIKFTIDPVKPVTVWVEKEAKERKRKAKQEPEDGDEWVGTTPDVNKKAKTPEQESYDDAVYTGKVIKQSQKQPSLWIVECQAITEWYGLEARLPDKLWPRGLQLGGTITFGIKETASGKPMICWAARCFEDRKARKGNELGAPEAQPGNAQAAGGAETTATALTAELRMADAEGAINAWAMDGTMYRDWKLNIVHHPETMDGLRFKVRGVAPNSEWEELKEHFSEAGVVSFCKIFKAYGMGQLTFQTSSAAEAALALYGSVCEGAELRVELNAKDKDGCMVNVFGLPPGFPPEALEEHFTEAGEVVSCVVREIVGR